MQIPASAYGNFSLYAALVSDKIVLGYPELIGISSGGTITVSRTVENVPDDEPGTSRVIIAAFFLVGILLIVYKRLRS